MEDPQDLQFSEGIAQTFSDAASQVNQKMRILVADGNATIRKLLRHSLANEAYELLEANDGNEALRLAMQRPEPHAILIDAVAQQEDTTTGLKPVVCVGEAR